MIDPELKQRILTTLRWMVADMKWRAEQTKSLPEGAVPEYSPEMAEAIDLLDTLEQTVPSPTEQQCKDLANMIGATEEMGSEYFHQYNSQGWLKGNHLPITDVRSHMVQWKIKNQGKAKTVKAVSSDNSKERLREDYTAYLEKKTTKALLDLKKDKGHLWNLCGWLINEILAKRAKV